MVGGYGVHNFDLVNDDDKINRTHCNNCNTEVFSGRCCGGPEYDPMPGQSHTMIYQHHQRVRQHGPYSSDHGLVPVCMKCQRDMLLGQKDTLMANPLITAMAEVASAHAKLSTAQAASATRSMTEAQASVV